MLLSYVMGLHGISTHVHRDLVKPFHIQQAEAITRLCVRLHSTVQHSTALHSTAQHCTAQHSTAQHSMSLLHVSQTHMADKVMNMTICRARLSETVWWLDPYIPPVDRLYLIVA